MNVSQRYRGSLMNGMLRHFAETDWRQSMNGKEQIGKGACDE